MGDELRFYRSGCAEGCIIQRFQIFPHRARGIRGINLVRLPFRLRCGILPVGVCLDQARISRKTLATHQSFLDAPRHTCLEDVPQQIAVP